MRDKLPFKEIKWSGDRFDYNRVCFYDPTNLYNLIGDLIKPFRRVQNLSMLDLFPNEKGVCACGCNNELSGRQTRWFNETHANIPIHIYGIINGHTSVIYFYLKNYHGENCVKCNRTGREVYEQDIKHLPHWNYHTRTAELKVDHIVPVKLGGGGGWLSNYQLLCHKCHVGKTNDDFGWKQPVKIEPIKQQAIQMQLFAQTQNP